MTAKSEPTVPQVGGGAAAGMTALRKTATGYLAASEDKLLLALIIVSAIVHIVILLLDGFSFLSGSQTPSMEEWSIDADLIQDFDTGAPLVSALPKAEVKAPEAKVQENMLPQLTKKVTIEDTTKPEETVADDAPKPKPETKEDVKEAEKPKEEPKINLKSDDESNKLKKEEALKRLALENLRTQEKTAKQTEAPEEDPLARIAAEAAKRKKLNQGAIAGAATGNRHKKYGGMLDAAVRQNYSLPEVYNLKGANMKVFVNIAVNDSGQLAELSVKQSSGDPVFDELTLQAVRASVPLPKPPPDLIGQTIVLVFSP